MRLSIKNITKRYGDNLALDNFTAEFEPGIYVLLGPNGSGKSTLMNIITDNLKADSGQITCDGEDTLAMGVSARRSASCRSIRVCTRTSRSSASCGIWRRSRV